MGATGWTRTNARFTQTSYTLVRALGDREHGAAAADELTRIYWPAVYAYLRRSGLDRDAASEMAQSFFYKKVFQGELFARYDPSRGRLRGLILSALKHHVIDEHRGEVVRGKGRIGGVPVTAVADPASGSSCPEDAFERRWATVQLEEAMRRCEGYFRENGRGSHWEAFADRIYHPVVHSTSPPSHEELACRLGFRKAADVAAAIQLVKRRVLLFLREIVAETIGEAEDADEEYGQVLGVLSCED